jgi:hypothetical protein
MYVSVWYARMYLRYVIGGESGGDIGMVVVVVVT